MLSEVILFTSGSNITSWLYLLLYRLVVKKKQKKKPGFFASSCKFVSTVSDNSFLGYFEKYAALLKVVDSTPFLATKWPSEALALTNAWACLVVCIREFKQDVAIATT